MFFAMLLLLYEHVPLLLYWVDTEYPAQSAYNEVKWEYTRILLISTSTPEAD